MKSKEIRETYLSFFESKGHARVTSAPVVPQILRNLPLLLNFTILLLPPEPWPSATKMSPLGAMSTSEGPLNSYLPSPAIPFFPKLISSFPLELNLCT